MTTTSNYALRLQKSLLDEVKRIAAAEGTTINQFINVAVAEKAAALRTEAYFRERVGRAELDSWVTGARADLRASAEPLAQVAAERVLGRELH